MIIKILHMEGKTENEHSNKENDGNKTRERNEK